MLIGLEMPNDSTKLDYRDPEWVAEKLGIDKNTVYRYLQDGTLPGLQLGRKWLVSERRLSDFLERVEREQTARRRDVRLGHPPAIRTAGAGASANRRL